MKVHKKSRYTRSYALGFFSLICVFWVLSAFAMEEHELSVLDLIGPVSPLEDSSINDLVPSQEPEKHAQGSHRQNNYLEILGYLKKNKLDQAKERLKNYYQDDRKNSQYLNLLALINIIENDLDEANQNLTKSIEVDPTGLTAYLVLAKLELQQGAYESAQAYVTQAIDSNKQSVGNSVLLADSYLLLAAIATKKDSDKVEQILLNGYKDVYGNIDAEVKIIKGLGRYYLSLGTPEKINNLADDLVQRFPNQSKALSVLAGAQIVNNANEQAQETLQTLIDQDSQDTHHRLLLINILSKAKAKASEAKALVLLDEVAAIEPDKPRARFLKAIFLNNQGKHKEAMALADAIEAKFPRFIYVHQLKGDIYFAQKNYQQALSEYLSTYDSYKNEQLLNAIVRTQLKLNKRSEAIALLERALKADTEQFDIRLSLAELYRAANDFNQSKHHYAYLLDKFPDNAVVLNNLAMLHLEHNDKDQALVMARKAYRVAPESVAIIDTYGFVLVKNGMAKEGIPLLEKAHKLLPKVKEVRLHLAESYLLNGDRRQAEAVLEPIIQAEEVSPEKTKAIGLLGKTLP